LKPRFCSLKTRLPKLGQECIVKFPNGNTETAFFSRGPDGTAYKFITWYGEETFTDNIKWRPRTNNIVTANNN